MLENKRIPHGSNPNIKGQALNSGQPNHKAALIRTRPRSMRANHLLSTKRGIMNLLMTNLNAAILR